MVIEGQLNLFDIETKPLIDLEKQKITIDEIVKNNKNCEVVHYKSGVVGVIADYQPKEIIPQGNKALRFTPKWNRKTYFVDFNGNISAIAVGAYYGEG